MTRVLAKTLAWRLSIAELRGRMPFSQLGGMDRILIPLSSQPLRLTIDGIEHQVSREEGIRFRGESRVVASVDRGGVSVVNLMVRRTLAEAEVRHPSSPRPGSRQPFDHRDGAALRERHRR